MPNASTRAAPPRGGTKPGCSMKRSASSATVIPIGTLTVKIQCQLDHSMRYPPRVGPSKGPLIAPSPNSAAAMPCSCFG